MADEQPGPIARARPLVHGDRHDEYGHPADDFARTAGMWRALFGWDVSPEDVPLAMIAVKLSRLRQSPHHLDSATDVAGYIEAYEMTLTRTEDRPDAPSGRYGGQGTASVLGSDPVGAQEA